MRYRLATSSSHTHFYSLSEKFSVVSISSLCLWNTRTLSAMLPRCILECGTGDERFHTLWGGAYISGLSNFLVTWRKLEWSERRDPQLRKCPIRPGCRQAWSFLIHDWCRRVQITGQCQPWAGGSGFWIKANWASHREQPSENLSLYGLCISSWF